MLLNTINRRLSLSDTNLIGHFGQESNLMGHSGNDYIPLFTTLPPYVVTRPFNISGSRVTTFQLELHERIKNKVGDFYPAATIMTDLGAITDRPHYEIYKESYLKTYFAYINKSDFIYKAYMGRHAGGNSYDDVFAAMKVNYGFTYHNLRSAVYISSHYFIGIKGVGNTIDLVGTMVFKKEHMEYIKLCILLGEEIDPSLMEFWLIKDFDTKSPKDSKHPNLRAAYRRSFKNHLIELGVRIVEKDNFDELFYSIEAPKFSSIADHKKWLEYSTSKFIYFQRNKLNIKTEEFFSEVDKYEIRRKVVVKKEVETEKAEVVTKEEQDLAFVIINESGLVEDNQPALPPGEDNVWIRRSRRRSTSTSNILDVDTSF